MRAFCGASRLLAPGQARGGRIGRRRCRTLLPLPYEVQHLRAVFTQLERVGRGKVDASVDHDLADLLVVLGVGSVISQVDKSADVLAEPGDLFPELVGS